MSLCLFRARGMEWRIPCVGTPRLSPQFPFLSTPCSRTAEREGQCRLYFALVPTFWSSTPFSPYATTDGAQLGCGAHSVLTFLRCCDPPPSAAGLEIPWGPNGAGDRAQAADRAECRPDPGAQAGRAAEEHSACRGAGPLFPPAANATRGLRRQDARLFSWPPPRLRAVHAFGFPGLCPWVVPPRAGGMLEVWTTCALIVTGSWGAYL